MRLTITLSPVPEAGDRIARSSTAAHVVVDLAELEELRQVVQVLREHVDVLTSRLVTQGRPISMFLDGPHDQTVRRGIPEGEHIIEEPLFDPIGFYGLVQIDRQSVPVVQWYRWIPSTGNYTDQGPAAAGCFGPT